MSEIQIPDDLTHDCDNCQGLCCVALAHRPESGFPILNPKPAALPCQNLETDPTSKVGLYKCKIHAALDDKGWGTCPNYTCFGAGQTISKFFQELGVSWALKPENMDENKWKIMVHNLYTSYAVLDTAFGSLHSFKNSDHPLHEELYQVARKAVTEVAKELATVLEKGELLINFEGYEAAFNLAIMDAVREYVSRK